MDSISLLLLRVRLIFTLLLDVLSFVLKSLVGTTTVAVFLLFLILFTSAVAIKNNIIQEQVVQKQYYDLQKQRNSDWTLSQVNKWEKIASDIPSRVAYVYLAQLYEFLGQPEKAKAAISEAKKLDPNYFAPHFPASN